MCITCENKKEHHQICCCNNLCCMCSVEVGKQASLIMQDLGREQKINGVGGGRASKGMLAPKPTILRNTH